MNKPLEMVIKLEKKNFCTKSEPELTRHRPTIVCIHHFMFSTFRDLEG